MGFEDGGREIKISDIKLLLIELGLLFVLQPSETPIPNIEEEIQVLTFYHLMEVVPKELWKQSF